MSFGQVLSQASGVTGFVEASGFSGLKAKAARCVVCSGFMALAWAFAFGGLASTPAQAQGPCPITISDNTIMNGCLAAGNATITIEAGGSVANDDGIAIIGTGIDGVTITINGADGDTAAGVVMTTGTTDPSDAINLGANATVTNAGMISTTAESSDGIRVTTDADITNAAGATIMTGGGGSIGIQAMTDAMITNAGEIMTGGAGSEGIEATTDAMITNAAGGEISTTGVNANGIEATTGAMITNAGMISTTGGTADGIEVTTGAMITNAGTISTMGVRADGIFATTGATITNAAGAMITVAGDGAEGIQATTGVMITNAGMISMTGLTANAIEVTTGATVINSGTIMAEGADSNGIQMATGVVANSGTIVATGLGSSGIRVTAPSGETTVTNSGFVGGGPGVGGADRIAIRFNAGNDTLILQRSWRLNGAVEFGAGTNTLNIESADINTILKVTGAVSTLTTGTGLAAARDGDRILVIGQPNIGALGEGLGDRVTAVHRVVNARLATPGRGYWVDTTARLADYDADGSRPEHDYRHWGVAGGGDGEVGGIRIGFALGVLDERTRVGSAGNRGRLDSTSLFAGVYSWLTGSENEINRDSWYVNGAFIGGVAAYKDRLSFSEGGGTTQTGGKFEGIYISPSVTVGTHFPMEMGILRPSVQVSWVQEWHGDYNHAENNENLFRVEDSSGYSLDSRAELAWIYEPPAMQWRGEVRGGVTYRHTRGEMDVTTGASSDSIRSTQNRVGALGGVSVSWPAGDTFSVYGALDGEYADDATAGRLTVGLQGSF